MLEPPVGRMLMKKVNPYAALSGAAKAAPIMTAGILPLGGDGYVQFAILTCTLLAIAAVVDLFRTD